MRPKKKPTGKRSNHYSSKPKGKTELKPSLAKGNVRLNKQIENLMGSYEEASHSEKIKMSSFLVESTQKLGGRFLKFDTNTNQWNKVSNSEAHKKIAHSFRNLRRGR